MGKVTLKVNGERRELELAGETPLLWALRDQLDLVGTKYGCGIGLCGSCMVLVDGEEQARYVVDARRLARALR